jgi:hypothetical protein
MTRSPKVIVPNDKQLLLPFGPLRNRELLSNHWLEHRLPLEPEWREVREQASKAAQELIALWKVEKSRVEKYGNEAGLEEKFIQPIFKALGWHLKYQTLLQGREPDYALFLDEQNLDLALDAGRSSPDFWSHASLVADAKAWHVRLDRPSHESGRREYPPEQIEWYLDRSRRDYGILTNGRLWRLVPRQLGPNKPRFQTYLEVDLVQLLDSTVRPSAQLQLGLGGNEFDTFMAFFLLFSPWAYRSIDGRKPLIVRAMEGSSEYSLGVSEKLKERVFEALQLCIEGFVTYKPNKLDPSKDLVAAQEHSFVFLYRLLFIMYGEDRGLLPYRINNTYTQNRSLARHRDEVAAKLDNVSRGLDKQDYSRTEAHIWHDLKDLFDLIDRGHQRYGVPAYNGGLFNLESDPFLASHLLPDWYLARVLDQLGRAPQPNGQVPGLFRVDYRDLAIQQLGSVYEGLLELRPRYATEPMIVIRKGQGGIEEEKIVRVSEPLPRGFERTDVIYSANTVYLATDKGERRRSGSYYTPDHIVDHIVQRALGARCSEIFVQLQAEISAKIAVLAGAVGANVPHLQTELKKLQGSFDDRILQLKVLDPAMGSGHFLIRACQYLAEEIATNPFTSERGSEDHAGDESTITYWKRRVAEQCLHGVDLNPMAVELAKLALWLETVAADAPLTFLDHHLRCGDSIVGARISRLDSLAGDQGLLAGQFKREVEATLPSLLEPLAEIGVIASDTAEHVKQKESIYRRRFLPALQRFEIVADLWTAEAMQGGTVRPDRYAEALTALDTKRKFDEVVSSDWAKSALALLQDKRVSPFHWELAYPHVFLGNRTGERSGFDVILGNPPYDVLSEREIGENLDHFKRFISLDPTLEPSQVGKNNLYKIFVARCVELLGEGGRLSFIVPMALLGDEQANAIRHMLFSEGVLSETHAFPQKDNPEKRVFRDAKLSTAIFVYQKLKREMRGDGSFRSQVHPAQFIEPASPSLMLNSESVKLYDPENLTIVSCSQDDWDIVVALAKQPISRLGDFVPFFQGEVNQTVATSKGLLTDKDHGPLVIRGANISVYQLREASQGEDLYLDVDAFLAGKGQETKAFHHRWERVGLQESSPQNNFRRIIACRIPRGQFCNHKINYTTAKHSKISLELTLFVLNSSFGDWYFRLGSTNAAVSHYQLTNIPCPRFGSVEGRVDAKICARIGAHILGGRFDMAEVETLRLTRRDGCSPTVARVIERLVNFIEADEKKRGRISRTDRSRLADNAERCQAILDKTLFALLGVADDAYDHIKRRLTEML